MNRKAAVKILKKVIKRNSSLTPLRGVLVEALEDDAVLLTVTDLEQTVSVVLDEAIHTDAEPTWCYFAELESGADNFIPEHASDLANAIDDIDIDTAPAPEGAFEAIKDASLFVSKDDTRFTLKGVCLSEDGIVATDGKRLVKYDVCNTGLGVDVMVPASKLLKTNVFAGGYWGYRGGDADRYDLFVAESANGEVKYVTRPICGTYPNWKSVVSESGYDIGMEFDYVKMGKALRQNKSEEIDLVIDGTTLEIKDEVGVIYTQSLKIPARSIKLRFNRAFLLDFCRVGMGCMFYKDKNDPVRLSDDVSNRKGSGGNFGLIMPMRVK